MSTFGKNIFSQLYMLVGTIDCSKEACPPPCAILKYCDQVDTVTDTEGLAVRSWETVACVPSNEMKIQIDRLATFGPDSMEDGPDFPILRTLGYNVPVKSYTNSSIWNEGVAVKNYDLTGNRLHRMQDSWILGNDQLERCKSLYENKLRVVDSDGTRLGVIHVEKSA